MPTGSCLCGNIKVSYTGEPAYTALCYCDDCRKLPCIQVLQIPESNFKIEAGELKMSTKVSDFGNEIHTHLCPDCGTAMFRTGGAERVKGMIGLRGGVLDDQTPLNEHPPKIEVFVERRPKWVSQIPGALQLNSKYEILES